MSPPSPFRIPARASAAGIALLVLAASCARGEAPDPTADQASPTQMAANLYVSPDGDDDGAGSTSAEPLRSIQRALELVQPGQRILALPGTYRESIVLSDLGGASAPITLAGVPGLTILDGGRRLPVALWCEACRGLVLEGLIVRGYTDAGLVIAYSQDIVLRGLLVSHSGFDPQVEEWELEGYGIDLESSTRVLVENNQVTRIGPDPQRPGRLMGSSIVAYDCRECVIRGNLIFENTGGMVVEDSVDVLVEHNQLLNNDLDATAERWWDGAIWLDGGRDVTLRGNTIRGNLGPGLQISDEESAGPTGYVIEHNLVAENWIGLYLWGFGDWELPGEPTLRFSGNQIRDNELADLFVSPGWCLPPEPCE
jgi:parallel beta-helix repeat protein